MRQHKVAQSLRIAQPGTVADHQPSMGAQHGDVVRRRFSVGRADADVDQRDTRPIRPLEVIGRHLRRLQRFGQGRIGVGDLGIAGRDEGGIAAFRVAQHLAGVLLELSHRTVVGEQLGWKCSDRGRVMRQPGEE